jgi:PKD repeat protein
MKHLITLVLLFGASLLSAQKVDYNLYFTNETLLLAENGRDFAQHPDFQDNEFIDNQTFRVVQFYKIPNDATMRQLAKDGVTLLDYLPENAYIAAFAKNIRYDFLQNYNIRSVSKMRELSKINHALLPSVKNDWAMHGEESEIMIQFQSSLSYKSGIAALQNQDIKITKGFPSRNYVFAKIKINNIRALASQPFVAHLDMLPAAGEPEDNDSRALHESNQLDNEYMNDLRINGEGVNVQVRDDGMIGPHIDFAGRMKNLTRYNGSINHGDMVTSSSGGAGNLNPRFKGIATGAYYYITDYDQSFTDTTIGLHKTNNVLITNTSYTDGCNRYTNISQTIDYQLRTNPNLTHVFSAGNNNGADCGYGAGNQWGNVTGGHKQGKNCVAVANIDDNMAINTTSSRGPAHDGRLKPDVSAHGTDVNMTLPNNTYTVNSGTSFSAPITAGVLAVMHQAYHLENQGKDPNATLMKAILLNSATEIGNYGPDYKFGWGVANAQRAVDLIQNQQYKQDSVAQDEEKIIKIKMPTNIKLAKVMLVWNDFEANPGVKKALVNDLDLKVISPDGKEILPYVLDPTPKEANLNALAKRGRDSLNNVEQVAIENPTPDAEYQVVIKGYKMPKGKQAFYLAFDYYEDVFKPIDVKKEGFVQSEVMPIRWTTNGKDTSFVNISFSSDNGANWTFVRKVNINQTYHLFALPKVNTDKAKLKYDVAGKTYLSSNFSICAAAPALNFTKICPDSISVEWQALTAPVSYEIMTLGEKYMQPIGKTKATKITIPTPSNFWKNTENWFTIRTIFDSSGMIGRRRNAVSVPNQLKNCPLQLDLSVSRINSPQATYNSQCTPFLTDSVSISLKNVGLDSISDGSIYYQLDNEPVVKQDVAFNLKKLEAKTFVFQPKVNIGGIGTKTLKVWTSLLDGDQFRFNDTLVRKIEHNLLSINGFSEKFPYSQNFNTNATRYPYAWGNTFTTNDNMTWDSVFTVSSNGGRSKMMAIDFTASANNATDELYTAPVTIDSTALTPYLLFDVAYGFASDNFTDRLKVLVSDNCERSNQKLLVELKSKRLSTVNSQTALWSPSKASHWRTEALDLSAYKGKKITISFLAESRQNSVLYLDNIRFQNYVPVKPIAAISASDTAVCLGDTVFYSAANRDPSFTYSWTFQGGSPGTAIGAGPFSVIYNVSSNNISVALTQTSTIGTSTATISKINVLKSALAKFTALSQDLKVTLTNQSTDATDYLWDFGDGTTSTEKTPIHDYAKAGSYTIVLNSSNKCNTSKATRKVTMTSIAVKDIFEKLSAEIQPNPNDGNFDLVIDNQVVEEVKIKISDVAGKEISSKNYTLQEGISKLKTNLSLSPGLYLMTITSKERQGTLKFIVK